MAKLLLLLLLLFFSVFCLMVDVEVNKNAKKRSQMQPISSHADRTNLVNKRFYIWSRDFLLAGWTRVECPTGQDRPILTVQVANTHRICFLISCPLVVWAKKNTLYQIWGEKASILTRIKHRGPTSESQACKNRCYFFYVFLVSDGKCEVAVGGWTTHKKPKGG